MNLDIELILDEIEENYFEGKYLKDLLSKYNIRKQNNLAKINHKN